MERVKVLPSFSPLSGFVGTRVYEPRPVEIGKGKNAVFID